MRVLMRRLSGAWRWRHARSGLAAAAARNLPAPLSTEELQRSGREVGAAVVAALCASVSTGVALADAGDDDASDDHVFVNWSASHECRPRALHVPESVDDLERILATYHATHQKLRCMGAGVSPNGLGFSAETARGQQHEALLSMALFDRILDVDTATNRVTVEPGIVVGDLLDKLRDMGLTMQNVASIRDQQVGGITQAGCHGTGAKISPIDDHVVEMEIVTPAKGRLTLSATQNSELFALAKCGLGALGVVTKLTLQCVPVYYLAERTIVTTIEDVRKHHAQWLNEFQHLRYMWIPGTDAVVVVQCERITADQAASAAEAFPPPPFSADEQLQAPRQLYLELTQGRHDPDYLSWGFTTLRDRLLELQPLDRDHVKRVNEAEKAFWLRNQGYRVGLSTDIIGFDCGGQQHVQEVAFPTAGTLDIDFVESLMKRIEAAGVPAPAPIEQRWTATSASSLSPASSAYNPSQLFCWVGIIMYLPTDEEAERRAITRAFEDYVALYRDMMQPFGGTEHWAKLEWPEHEHERARMRARLAKRYPLDAFRQARDDLDPHHVLSNHIVDELLRQE
ncbi:hypothetical protein ATCC90586_002053 [Pythium insidiosum]|nr:hypothetical protein ATCC90586_002053 [Pythium insidiosum]